MSGDYPNYRIVEICQNTEKSPGDLRKLALIHTSVKNHWLMLLWKTQVGVNDNNYNNKNNNTNNAIRIKAKIYIKYIKAKIDKTQQNSKCRLCGDIDEMINCIIRERSKLEQKEYKTWHERLRKVIHWELCKKLEFDHGTTQNPSGKMRCTKFSGILRYKQIT